MSFHPSPRRPGSASLNSFNSSLDVRNRFGKEVSFHTGSRDFLMTLAMPPYFFDEGPCRARRVCHSREMAFVGNYEVSGLEQTDTQFVRRSVFSDALADGVKRRNDMARSKASRRYAVKNVERQLRFPSSDLPRQRV